MSEPRTETIDAIDGKVYMAERIIMKNGKMTKYVSLSNGMDVAGAYVTEKTIKEIIKFLTPKKEK